MQSPHVSTDVVDLPPTPTTARVKAEPEHAAEGEAEHEAEGEEEDVTPQELSVDCDEVLCVRRRASSGSTMSAVDLTTFEGCEDLLRAVPLSACLAQCGRLLASSEGHVDTFKLSRPVTAIDAFISHNWAVPRWEKFLALTFHFNLLTASIVALLALTLTAVLQTWCFQQRLLVPIDSTGGVTIGYLCRLVGAPVFFLTMLFGRSLSSKIRGGDRMVFLDKACIHQDSREMQEQGISKLSAFLQNSRRLVVVYSDLYPRRLWTLYEMASYFILQSAENIRIVPTFQAKLFAGIAVISYTLNNVGVLLSAVHVPKMEIYIIFFFASSLLGLLIRKFQRTKREAIAMLTKFDLQNCECLKEEDRPLVYSNIATMMRSRSPSWECLSDEEALENFNDLVRSKMPEALTTACGVFTFRYRHYLVLGCILDGGWFADSISGFVSSKKDPWHEEALETLWALVLLDLVWITVVWPLLLLGLDYVTSFRADLLGWRELPVVAAATVVVSIPITLARTASVAWIQSDVGARAKFLGCLLMLGILPPLPWFILNGRRCCHRKKSSDEELVYSHPPSEVDARSETASLPPSPRKVVGSATFSSAATTTVTTAAPTDSEPCPCWDSVPASLGGASGVSSATRLPNCSCSQSFSPKTWVHLQDSNFSSTSFDTPCEALSLPPCAPLQESAPLTPASPASPASPLAPPSPFSFSHAPPCHPSSAHAQAQAQGHGHGQQLPQARRIKMSL